MISYEEIKNWWSEKENRDKVVLGAAFVVIFLVGFGAGRYERGVRCDAQKFQTNYTTNTQPKATTEVAGANTDANAQTNTATSTASTNCPVKGNIGSGGKKIYHIKGGAFYERTNPEQCFKTQAEAQAAGYVKSSR